MTEYGLPQPAKDPPTVVSNDGDESGPGVVSGVPVSLIVLEQPSGFAESDGALRDRTSWWCYSNTRLANVELARFNIAGRT